MRCPLCLADDSQVKDSRTSNNDTVVRRRRYCPSCHAKFTTIEKLQIRKFYVIKRSGVKKFFDREKIIKAINLATRKRNISIDEIERITNDVINHIENTNTKEVTTSEIGEIIMKALFEVDQVAYIRFASVYLDFKNSNDFINFVSNLQNKKGI